MKRRLLPLVALAAFAAPAFGGDSPGDKHFVEELLARVFNSGEPVVVEREGARRELLAAADDAKFHAEAMKRWAEDFSRDISTNISMIYGPRFSSSKVVKGQPYSAEVITEAHQALADGNVISRKTAGVVYRDSEGRTRQEAGEGKKAAIYISDPVDGKNMVLLPESKRAIVTPRPKVFAITSPGGTKSHHVHEMRYGSTLIRIEDGKVTVDGKDVTNGNVELKTSNGKNVRIENGKVFIDGKEVGNATRSHVIVKSGDEKEAGDGPKREEVRVQVVRSGDREISIPMANAMALSATGPLLAPPLMPGMHTLRFESTAALGKGVTTTMGSRDFEGVRADGKSTVWTIPAGQIGNKNPIQITSESWYSPELQVTVYSRYHDPRTGESIYKLASLKRADPPKDLFTVPGEYEMRDKTKREREPRESRDRK
jgi:hypothetical protein